MNLMQLSFPSVVICSLLLSSTTNAFTNEGLLEEPTMRFTPFSMLPENTVSTIEDGLGYREDSWNLLGSSSLEEMSWETNTAEVADFVENSAAIGILNEATWDCHINHFVDYWWSELEENGMDVRWRALGYDATMWDVTGDTSEVEDFFWSEMTDEQRAAAEQLCYREEIWNEIPLSFWPAPSTSTAVQTPAASPASLVPTVVQFAAFPDFRFVEWTKLDMNHMSLVASTLGYSEDTWNVPGTAYLETLSFSTIASLGSTQVTALKDLGFNRPTWDCYVNHFGGFGWDSLEAPERTAFETLGWTAELWRGDGTPESELKSWSELSSEEEIAADTLCYSALTWDGVPLTDTARWNQGGNTVVTDSDTSDGRRSLFTSSAWVAAVAGLLFL